MSTSGKKSSSSKKTSNSLKPTSISGHKKVPGQTGLAAPGSIDALRKPSRDQRTSGKPFVAGVSEPVVSDQTYDLYNTRPKSPKKGPKKS